MPYKADEAITPGFDFRVYLLLDNCLTRLMRLPPQDLKTVYQLLDSCQTRLRLSQPTKLKREPTKDGKQTNNHNHEENKKLTEGFMK